MCIHAHVCVHVHVVVQHPVLSTLCSYREDHVYAFLFQVYSNLKGYMYMCIKTSFILKRQLEQFGSLFLQLQTSFISTCICLHHDIYKTAENQSKYLKINQK